MSINAHAFILCIMDDEKLIECVRKYEFLYNLQHPKYMDSMKKEMAWKQISEQMKQPGAVCKQRWQGLRDAYRRAINKRKGKTGQTAKKMKKWKYENEMSFITSFFVERKTLESVELTSEDVDPSNNDESIETQNSIFDNKMNITNTDVADSKNNTIEMKTEDDTIVCKKFSQPQYSQTKKAKNIETARVLPVHSASDMLMTRLLDEQNNPPQRGLDELDRFFLSTSDTVKKFPPYLQALAKNKIFSLVSEMELQQLAPPGCTT